jgi:hypothetical protein
MKMSIFLSIIWRYDAFSGHGLYFPPLIGAGWELFNPELSYETTI